MNKFKVSFIISGDRAEDDAKLFVEDASKETNGAPIVSWNDVEGDIHEWEVSDVKYEVVNE